MQSILINTNFNLRRDPCYKHLLFLHFLLLDLNIHLLPENVFSICKIITLF